ncbi:hypothetical protein [Chryseolinea lacunae]|uniref:DUF2306 domain-containing protein n=1 Tax=Chryseolinea lacunae TaxID=2801331 RepID=A0ABS1KTA4_9BACT|nr:hypothetical protein [Chryseolinea lacunae]MBL0741531.1 hypothetical protein [Chryseolinea lacunae]
MEKFFTPLLVLHIAGGAAGLLSGSINIVRSKGDNLHRKVGIVFLYGMLIAGVSSLLLAVLHLNYFLFMVGVFTLYLVGTGQRYLSLKNLGKGQRPALIDWILTVSMIVFGLAFIVKGGEFVFGGQTFGAVFLVFGFFGLRLARKDINHYQGKVRTKRFWLVAHLQRMIGCYIAALTAFIVVNNTALPPVVAWLAPVVLLVPLIVRWSRQYRGDAFVSEPTELKV